MRDDEKLDKPVRDEQIELAKLMVEEQGKTVRKANNNATKVACYALLVAAAALAPHALPLFKVLMAAKSVLVASAAKTAAVAVIA
jgi:hypothetical protein